MKPPRPHALTFDVFGTVVDWRSSVIRECRRLTETGKIPELDCERFADDWRGGYVPSMHRVRTGDLPWTNLDRLHRMILDGLVRNFHIRGLNEDDLRHLNSVWHRLDPWPDAIEGLARLRRQFVCAALSNGNLGLLVDLSRSAGLTWDCVLSAEFARHYKPDLEVYQTAASLLNIEPSNILMVAAHKVDLQGARSAGFQTAFVYRPNERGPYGSSDDVAKNEFDYWASDFFDLAEQLGA